MSKLSTVAMCGKFSALAREVWMNRVLQDLKDGDGGEGLTVAVANLDTSLRQRNLAVHVLAHQIARTGLCFI